MEIRMMEIRIPPSMAGVRNLRALQQFLQSLVNRLLVGALRYEKNGPQQENKYLSRMERELKAYKRTGNMECLFNIANYAFLESRAPENPRFHHDACAGSNTRREFGGKG